MKLKLDESILVSLKAELVAIGHDVHSVVDEALVGGSDERIWTRCQEEERLPVTQDLDFSESRKFKPGRHAGPLLIRLALIPVSHAGAFQVDPELKKNWPKI